MLPWALPGRWERDNCWASVDRIMACVILFLSRRHVCVATLPIPCPGEAIIN